MSERIAAFVAAAVLFAVVAPNAGAQTGSAPVATPCGEVFFRPVRAPRVAEDGTVSETIGVTFEYPGHRESATFPYPWVYPDGERTDPWSTTNLAKPDFDVRLIGPPPGADVAAFPPLIRFVLDHTNADGFTTLSRCDARPADKPRLLARIGPESRTDPLYLSFSDASAAGAPIEITAVKTYDLAHARLQRADHVCIAFRNRSPKTATAVQVRFTELKGGRVAQGYYLDLKGTYAPNVVIDAPPEHAYPFNTRSFPNTCPPITWDPEIHLARFEVTWVGFADGTTWGSPAPNPVP